jgi:glycosyltransferase involved in cell wall biosynthesis
VRVLYLNHTALVSGAEHSLLTLMEGLPPEVEPCLACPAGQLADLARAAGVPVVEVAGTEGSLRLHPIHTPRTFVDLGRAAVNVRATAKRAGVDLIHANTVRAGLIASAVSRFGGPPAVAHVRDRLPPGALSDVTLRALLAGTRIVIANSRYTAERIPSGRAQIRVISNPVNLKRFDPGSIDPAAARSRLGLDSSDFVLAVIGQITPWKGQDLAIQVAGEISSMEPSVRLLIAGSAKFKSGATRLDNPAYLAELQGLVERMGLGATVRFLGERQDVPEILAATDVVLVPSWEEPFGRAIIEAMAMGVPVIATDVGGPAEIVRDRIDGLLRPPRDPDAWARAVRELIAEPDRLETMGRRGREQALARFGVEQHVKAVLAAYEDVVR